MPLRRLAASAVAAMSLAATAAPASAAMMLGTCSFNDLSLNVTAGATPGMFLKANGEPMAWRDGVVGGRSTGVPGAIVIVIVAKLVGLGLVNFIEIVKVFEIVEIDDA